MDEVNEYYLELPEHLRPYVAKDAPPEVRAVQIETQIEDATLAFLAGAWPLVANLAQQNYWSQIFIQPLKGESKPFLRFDSWSRCASPAEFENYPLPKLKALSRDLQHGENLVRSFRLEGIEEELELYANHWDFSKGRWKPKDWLNHAVTPFQHRFFASYREFCELPDEIVLERISAQVGDDDREINLSRRWATMDKEQKATETLFCEQGTWKELEELSYCVLRVLAHHLTAQDEVGWSLHNEAIPYFSELDYSEDEVEQLEAQWRPRLELWRECLFRYFKPKYFFSKASIPLCIETWANRHVPIAVNTPSAHELLEAQLRLIQWAHENCSPAEAATLLQFEP